MIEYNPSDPIGYRNNMLMIVSEVPFKRKGRSKLYLAVCECGGEIEVIAANVKRGHNKSCGCLKKTVARINGKKNTKKVKNAE